MTNIDFLLVHVVWLLSLKSEFFSQDGPRGGSPQLVVAWNTAEIMISFKAFQILDILSWLRWIGSFHGRAHVFRIMSEASLSQVINLVITKMQSRNLSPSALSRCLFTDQYISKGEIVVEQVGNPEVQPIPAYVMALSLVQSSHSGSCSVPSFNQ